MTKVNIPTFKLANGQKIPALGYGTWLGVNERLERLVEDVPKLVEAMSYAIDIGYRHIDTAHVYGVEPEIGELVREKIANGVVKREEMFITTKVWQNFHREADVEVALRGSLRRLNLDYVDMVLMHWPMSISEEGVDEKIDYLETWRGLESVLSKGLTKGIGVSNFNIQQLERLLANCKVQPACNQVEINLNLGQNELVKYCQSKNILIVGYTPLGTRGMIPTSSVPNSPDPKENNPILVQLAKKYGKTVSQIVLRYVHQRGVAIIPKTITKTRVLENASIFDFHIDGPDCDTLAQMDNGFRTFRPLFWQEFENYPFDKLELESETSIPAYLLKWKNGAKMNID